MCRLKTHDFHLLPVELFVTTLILHAVNFSGLVAEALILTLVDQAGNYIFSDKLMGQSFSFLFFWNWTLVYLKEELSLTYFCAHTYSRQCSPRLVLLLFFLTQNIFKTFLLQSYS